VAWVKQAVAKGALVLDVRKDDEWAAGRLANAVHIPLAQVQDRAGELPKGRLVVTVCKDGGRSYKAAYALRQAGYDAVNLAGGLTAWAAAGLPVVTDSGAPGRIM
jgi:rhodanese-related sulfurtransferase